jgi:hypothetical protein
MATLMSGLGPLPDLRPSLNIGHRRLDQPCPKGADFVAEVGDDDGAAARTGC